MGATHGKKGNVFSLRPNGFSGSGLNDLIWGTGFSGASSAYYEVVIDSEGGGTGGVDTFMWRKNGGTWTTNVDITGAAQTLDDDQQITFPATTGHTLNDQWVAGNLKDEPCTVSGTTAQITDSTRRILDPTKTVTFTDSGGANVILIDYTRGKAYFDAAVTAVTVSGNLAHIPDAALERAGYLYDWKMEAALDLADRSVFQQHWKTWLPGMAGISGSAEGFFAGKKWFEVFEDCVDGTRPFFFLQLFTYDPDNDQTGDHFNVWAAFDNFNLAAPLGEIVKESVSWQVQGAPSFVPNA